MAMIDAREVHERDMREDAAYRQEYEALADEFQVVEILIAARTRAGKTQRDVAAAMGVKQPVVAQLETTGPTLAEPSFGQPGGPTVGAEDGEELATGVAVVGEAEADARIGPDVADRDRRVTRHRRGRRIRRLGLGCAGHGEQQRGEDGGDSAHGRLPRQRGWRTAAKGTHSWSSLPRPRARIAGPRHGRH